MVCMSTGGVSDTVGKRFARMGKLETKGGNHLCGDRMSNKGVASRPDDNVVFGLQRLEDSGGLGEAERRNYYTDREK